jgi:lipoate-protein ligase A
MGIAVKRGIVGGGPIYGDFRAVWCGAFLRRGVDPVPAVDELTLMRTLCSIADQVSELWKIPMRYRPLNDGEIWDAGQLLWRKVLAAGSTGMGDIIQISFILQVKSPETTVMEKIITPPPEKFADKVAKTVGQRVISLEDAVGRALSYEEIKDVLVSSFRKAFGVEFYAAGLTTAEEKMIQEAKSKYDNEDWLYNRSERKFGTVSPDVRKGEALCKAPGGPLLRVTILKRKDVLHDILFTGSLQASPIDSFLRLEEILKGTSLTGNELEQKISSFCNKGVTTPGLTLNILLTTIKKAIEKAG